jgi:perosamine synthetase
VVVRRKGNLTLAEDIRKIPLLIPLLGDEEAQAAAEAVKSGWVTQGPRVVAFEQAFAAKVGADYAVATSSCTTALHLALRAAGVKHGQVVITASHSFIATANAVRYLGAEPVFVDIDPATYNIDPEQLALVLDRDFERKSDGLYYRDVQRLACGESPLVRIKEPHGRLGAILVVHQVGIPADLARILPQATEAGVPVVEDAAAAVGCQLSLDGGHTWEMVGRPHGLAACFSFHPRKLLTTGDGGMLTTNDPEVDSTCRLLRHHGMSVPDLARHQAGKVIVEQYLTTGYNYRLTDIQAAVGLEQLKRLDYMLERRRELASIYLRELKGIPGLNLPAEPAYGRNNWQSFVVWLDDASYRLPVMEELLGQGISSRQGIMNAHAEPPYRQAWPEGSLPQSEKISQGGLVLPLFPQMAEEDCLYVCRHLRFILG